MAKPKFKNGDHVELRGGGNIPGGVFEVVRALPDEGRGLAYRVRSVRGGQEHVVQEFHMVRVEERKPSQRI
jgi:hypothetical protein